VYLVRPSLQVTAYQEPRAPLGVSIISEVKFIGESLVDSLSRDNRLSVHGAFDSWNEGLSGASDDNLEVVLIDSALNGGLTAVKLIRGTAPGVLVVVIGLTETYEDVIAWAEAGIAGYVPKHESLSDVPTLLLRIAQGEQSCSASVASGLLRNTCRKLTPPDQSPELTTREAQIIELIAAGMTNKEIARRLNIGLPTAKTHVHHLLGKLHLQRRTQAAEWIRRQQPRAIKPVSSRALIASQDARVASNGRCAHET
jgi:DNA-binding NarL/FixJ family response regulator